MLYKCPTRDSITFVKEESEYPQGEMLPQCSHTFFLFQVRFAPPLVQPSSNLNHKRASSSLESDGDIEPKLKKPRSASSTIGNRLSTDEGTAYAAHFGTLVRGKRLLSAEVSAPPFEISI